MKFYFISERVMTSSGLPLTLSFVVASGDPFPILHGFPPELILAKAGTGMTETIYSIVNCYRLVLSKVEAGTEPPEMCFSKPKHFSVYYFGYAQYRSVASIH